MNPKSQTLNPKPYTLNPKPLNPKPCSMKQERSLRVYIDTVAPMIASARAEVDRAARAAGSGGGTLALDSARGRFATLAARVQSECAVLTWGSSDGEAARAKFVQQYGCTAGLDAS